MGLGGGAPAPARGGVEGGEALHGIDGGDLAAGGLFPLLANC
jgi:hypothetical protein